MAGKLGTQVEEFAGLAVGAYAPQAAADFSGPHAVRNGLGTAVAATLLGAAGWAFGGRHKVIRAIGEGLAKGAVAWGVGVGGQHMDHAIIEASSKKTNEAQRAASEAERTRVAADHARVDLVAPLSGGDRRVVPFRYPNAEEVA